MIAELTGERDSTTRRLKTTYGRAYDIRMIDDLLSSGLPSLSQQLASRSALIISTPRVNELYGKTLRARLAGEGIDVPLLTIDVSENTKNISKVQIICQEAQKLGLDRKAVLVALGGGVCSDLVTVAASWIRRGIGYICVPTTLIGQVDAAIGIKGAVNFCGKKNFVGVFYPPESVFIDPGFLRTLPRRFLGCGAAEILKMAVVCDRILFEHVERNIQPLLASGFSHPTGEAREILWRAVMRMTDELEQDFYEDQTYRRLVDFGHTFSPSIENVSNFQIQHGEAVSIDMALTCAIGAELGVLDPSVRDRIISVLRDSELPLYSPLLTERLCTDALEESMRHRGGAVNLVLPTEIGKAIFHERSDRICGSVLQAGLQWLARQASRRASIVNPISGCLVFDIGGTTIRAASYDQATDTLSDVTVRRTPNCLATDGAGIDVVKAQLLQQMCSMANEILSDEPPACVSISFPGPFDSQGRVLAAPTIWGTCQDGPLDLLKDLRTLWPLSRIALLNDVSAAGYRYHNGKGDDFCIVTVSSGIGNKVFIGGRPIVGGSGYGGEIGHVQVDSSPSALVCDCGGSGHLGAIASGRGATRIAKRKAEKDMEQYSASALGRKTGADSKKITSEAIVCAFTSGDKWTVELIKEVARPLAQQLSSIHQSIGIERFIVIGGFALALGEGYRRELVSFAIESCWNKGQNWDNMIELGFSDDMSGLLGAGKYITRFLEAR